MGDDDHKPPPTTEEIRQNMISSFTTEITSSSEQVAILILEAHQWDIAAAVSAFRDAVVAAAAAAAAARPNVPSPIRLRSPRSPSRVFSPRSARNPFSREAMERDGNILSDSDEKENEDPMESDDVERDLSSLPRRLKFRSLSEILSVIPQEIPRTVTLYRNGYTFDDDNILWPLDDPQCAEFLEVVESLESPRALDSPGGKRRVLITLIIQQDSSNSFQGVGRTLAEPDSVPPASSDSLTTEATPSMNPTAPTTSIKVILADGTPIVSRFTTTHHTIRDVRDFIDAARPDASRDYQLLIMGSSAPKLLTTDLDQTIDQAGISNSVLTLKF
ncbi:PREDICTED: plant UBX domain-containing protein 5-like [Brassica oleracea var. oleracea]|uniref:plant UBX domain-containing protein 5-like n=1 Tax=Brassica oleracea var. oleracea TaxID=109376 RepID=UPI0006A6ABC2|nr:PREDICTED: plant UBX domain-containing protein 5-like [Brassica oleracea var. oleracea]